MRTYLLMMIILLSSCQERERKTDDLSTLKSEFLKQISISNIEEGPFSFNYSFKPIFFSENVISLFGELSVHDRLPHGWQRYEGKTLCKINGKWKEIQLSDLFQTDEQKESLRNFCEKSLQNNPLSYFSGDDPLRTNLKHEDIQTFVVDDQHLTIIFQPYSVGGCIDSPFQIKISLDILDGHWNPFQPSQN